MAVLSFEHFYRVEHAGQVRRAFLILGSSAAAHDVVATAFESVLTRWERIEEPGPYLSVCVLNACRDAAKKRNREITVDRFPDVSTEDPAEHLADCLAKLPFRQRAAVVLRFYGGESEAAIADYLQCAQGTVGSLIHRGLKSLRSQLKEEVSR